MFPDRDFDRTQKEPWNGPELVQDLQLDTVFKTMAAGNDVFHDMARMAMLSGPNNGSDIVLYRQAVLSDCLQNPALVKSLYALAVDAVDGAGRCSWGMGVSSYPPSILAGAVETLQMFLGALAKLRNTADEHAGKFESPGFTELFARIKREISDEYLDEIDAHLKELRFRGGVLIGARLGRGNKGANYVLRQPNRKKGWLRRVFGNTSVGYTFRIGDRDEAGRRALGELNSRGVNLVANAAAQSVEHILGFFVMLQAELAFYLGCVNLRDRLTEIGEPVCFPVPAPAGERRLVADGLYDLSLALAMGQPVVANDINADNRSVVIVTGANKGGKTTFLRSVGLAQTMMQCGMFVPARSFSANLCAGLYTHFKRKEDVSMESGKLDEELNRMSAIADHLTADSMVLFNEAFAATNEREGAEIAREIVTALSERRVNVFFVSHLHQFTHGLYEKRTGDALFLRAEREADGTRTYKLIEGEPLETSYGEDLYQRIFVAGEDRERDTPLGLEPSS